MDDAEYDVDVLDAEGEDYDVAFRVTCFNRYQAVKIGEQGPDDGPKRPVYKVDGSYGRSQICRLPMGAEPESPQELAEELAPRVPHTPTPEDVMEEVDWEMGWMESGHNFSLPHVGSGR